MGVDGPHRRVASEATTGTAMTPAATEHQRRATAQAPNTRDHRCSSKKYKGGDESTDSSLTIRRGDSSASNAEYASSKHSSLRPIATLLSATAATLFKTTNPTDSNGMVWTG